jgi:hypothetical protein
VEFAFTTDTDTKRLFEIAVHFLQQYFAYDLNDAVSLVNRYYQARATKHDDDYYHHEGSFQIAVQAHYFIGLSKDPAHYPEWKKEHGLINAPREAIDYFNEHYFVK